MRIAVAISLLLLAASCAQDAGAARQESQAPSAEPAADATRVPFLERRAAHTTRLDRDGPSTEEAPPLIELEEGVDRVSYRSGDLELVAYVLRPEGAGADTPAPAVLYLHGDLNMKQQAFAHARVFAAAGFIVYVPTLRGRNGNAGRFELLYGEVDDALAAAQALAARDDVDKSHVYAIGHSMGGATSAMLSLFPEAPLLRTASVGGIYTTDTFRRWAKRRGTQKLVRFDAADRDELELRVLSANLPDLVHPHTAYVGEEEPFVLKNAREAVAEAEAVGASFELKVVEGDHMSALEPALADFAEALRAEAFATEAP
jgi:dienelactone hydrolase